jgi:hypothetical protein
MRALRKLSLVWAVVLLAAISMLVSESQSLSLSASKDGGAACCLGSPQSCAQHCENSCCETSKACCKKCGKECCKQSKEKCEAACCRLTDQRSRNRRKWVLEKP